MDSKALIAKPVCNGKKGHPILLSCSILPSLIACKTKGGLKEAISQCCKEEEIIDVSDEGILQDADTPEDYRQLIQRHNRQMLRPYIEISLMRENKLFDKNVAMLLHMIRYSGTVKEACEKMHISYSKGWNMLSALEKNLGYALVNRQHGGEFGGASRLTAKGSELLNRYDNFVEKVKRYADECFNECFDKET